MKFYIGKTNGISCLKIKIYFTNCNKILTALYHPSSIMRILNMDKLTLLAITTAAECNVSFEQNGKITGSNKNIKKLIDTFDAYLIAKQLSNS